MVNFSELFYNDLYRTGTSSSTTTKTQPRKSVALGAPEASTKLASDEIMFMVGQKENNARCITVISTTKQKMVITKEYAHEHVIVYELNYEDGTFTKNNQPLDDGYNKIKSLISSFYSNNKNTIKTYVSKINKEN